MNYLFIAYLLALLFSLFIASWRVAFLALAIESLVAALIIIRTEGISNWTLALQVAELLLIKSVAVPFIFMRTLKALSRSEDFDLLPANFVVWILAAIMIIASYGFGKIMFPNDFTGAAHLSIASSGILLGMFVLSNQTELLGQIIGLLTLDAGITLIETMGHPLGDWKVQLGLSLIMIWTLSVLTRFLVKFVALGIEPLKEAPPSLEERDAL